MILLENLKKWKREREQEIAFWLREGEKGISVTYGKWISDSCSLAGRLMEKGWKKKNIAVILPNCYEWFVAFYGIILSGNIAVSINWELGREELENLFGKMDIQAVFLDSSAKSNSEDVVWQKRYIEDLSGWLTEEDRGIGKTEMCLEELEEQGLLPEDNETAFMLLSSGTSGSSKGVMLSLNNLFSMHEDFLWKGHMDSFLVSLPLHHVAAVQLTMMFLAQGTVLAICESGKYLMKDLLFFKPQVMSVVPLQLDFIAGRAGKRKEVAEVLKKHTKYIVSLGAPLMNEHEEIFGPLGVEILNTYGLTEVTGAITDWFPHRKGSIGRLSRVNACRLENGELAVKGPSVMKGYYKNMEETEEILRNGWLYTGDMARMDEEGFLYLTGRKKNTIILSNGENVSPEELEEKASRCTVITEIIVFAKSDMIQAEIYLDEDNKGNREAVEKHIAAMNEDMPVYRQIRRINFRKAPFEKTGSGKIKRFLLEQENEKD